MNDRYRPRHGNAARIIERTRQTRRRWCIGALVVAGTCLMAPLLALLGE
ncbi:MAG TPA: hypothetical protein VI140_11745 [Oxalicibacterium sp.]